MKDCIVVPYFKARPKSVSSACTMCRRLAIEVDLARGVDGVAVIVCVAVSVAWLWSLLSPLE